MRFLFVGVARSQKAIAMDVTWIDGRLAAKQLFDALRANGIDPAKQKFVNVTEPGALDTIQKYARRRGTWMVVAMGQYVHLQLRGLLDATQYYRIVHPAARGTIRRKENYVEHIRRRIGSWGPAIPARPGR